MTRVLIMAAGTGGHVYPALAVAERLRACKAEVMWLGTKTGIESRLVPAAGFPFHVLKVKGLRGKSLGRRLAAPFLLLRCGIQALLLLRSLRPHVVLGMGGYGAGPGGIASRLLRIPLVIHEQNAVPGLTNRLLAPLAGRVLEAFPGSFAPRRRAIHTGNPVREGLIEGRSPRAKADFERPVLRLLILGGSQGAHSLNEAVPMAISQLRKDEARPADSMSPSPTPQAAKPIFEILHQCGAAHIEATCERYRSFGLKAEVTGYVEDMTGAYSWADLVICRAGAMTLAEIAVAGVASILVPFPFAVDDHQRHNADHLVRREAALRIVEEVSDRACGSKKGKGRSERLAAALSEALTEIRADRSRLASMARASYEAAVTDATSRVVDACLGAVLEGGKG
ncbi:undecaprenyldiphospho-muramoylpentapeptide beta-N-acetylglucosaminyltransferase [Thioalkalivibrio sp. HK1]|uniref:undecaprenyldiphospho-muramoylpentapeptide beta-N-acetylglucosaminyltransferase n=1 Tax=Thioalkalivibrio sp. HK1 TaxID=1469245 RepID=UPI000471AFBC|nr:undecaprenyldiphospho-muramoylpentapeptide beta-N-acetylglucosaminyltransferase [Thioalkalivibrio sp. HK1]